MRKKVIAIILSLMITSALFAQESSKKTITIGTDILPVIGGLPFGFVGLLHNEGKNEVNFGSFYFNAEDESISAIGLFPSYSFYPNVKVRGYFLREALGWVSSIGIINKKKCLQSHFGQLLT